LVSLLQIEDEGPEPEKKILVLGLENSGKSSILAQFTAPNYTNSAIAKVTPTQGFNAVNLINDGVSLKIYERKIILCKVTINLTGGLFGAVGGSSKVRQYWDNYLQDTDVLIFVVDSTQTLTTAAIELKRLLGDERLNHAPVLVFANMQVLKINNI
jgi:GTPase SAR1 family protein